MWVLILTLAFSSTRVEIERVDGFASKESCITAGNSYVKQNRVHNIYARDNYIKALCVKKL